MDTQTVTFWSEGSRVAALWRTPASGGPHSAVIHGPGWFGSKDAGVYERYHRHLTDAGFGVLAIDYRGFGDSEGERGFLSPAHQLEDLINAVTYLQGRPDADSARIGAFGTGATGGGNVVMLCATDDRVKAGVSQFPIADGRQWLREMRSEDEWRAFEAALQRDRRQRVATGRGVVVDPFTELMVAPPERAERGFKSDVRDRVVMKAPLALADAILRYRPIDAARRLDTPILFVAVEGDQATPEHHAIDLHKAVRGPKDLYVATGTSHYAFYDDRAASVLPRIAHWFGRYLSV